MSPETLLERMWEERATAILRTHNHGVARDAMTAAIDGGFRFIEFTLHCPRPFDLIESFAKKDGIVVGAGTVLQADDARRAIESGASFIVSPVLDEDVVGTTLEHGAVAMPGVRTPTEMVQAHRMGAAMQKLFPAPTNGPAYVRATLGPLPFLRLVPTYGVNAENVGEYIASNVFAVGFVSPVFPTDVLADRNFTEVERLAREALTATRAVQRPAQPRGHDPFACTPSDTPLA